MADFFRYLHRYELSSNDVFYYIILNSQEVQLPHGNQLKVFVDQGFDMLDKNHDGVLTNAELTFTGSGEDANHDGNLTLAEFATYWNMPVDEIRPLFNAYVTGNENVVHMNSLQQWFHLMDTNDNGELTKTEYEHYMMWLLECAYAPGNHGHEHNCHV